MDLKCIIASLNSRYIHSNLAIRYIKEYLSQNPLKDLNGDEVEIETYESTINDEILNMAYEILERKPDILGFSCYIWNIEKTLKLCSIIKTIKPEIILIFGGPEVSYDTEKMMRDNSFIDFIIKGEGEETFKELMNSIINKDSDIKSIKGIVFRDGIDVVENQSRELICNLDLIPFPYKSGLPSKILYYEASRGCPFGCSYCLSSVERRLRFFSIDRVKKDLLFFINKDVKLVKFVDRTFNSNKEFAMAIWKFLIENNKETTFHFEISADLLSEEEMNLLKTAPKGLFQFEVGVQTTNKETLKNINRRMDFDKLKDNIMSLKETGNIHCHLDLIAGLPGDDLESFKRSFDMCMELKPDVLQLGFLKILKGSLINNDIDKYGIKYVNYPPYQVLKTGSMSYEDIDKLIKIETLFEDYYNSGIFKTTFDYLIQENFINFSFFEYFLDFARDREYFNKKLGLNDKFKLFYEFALGKIKGYYIMDLLLIDYTITNKKSYLPDFLKNEMPSGFKGYIADNREKIFLELKSNTMKSIFAAPTNTVVKRNNGFIEIEEKKSVIVFNLESGEYIYLY